MTSRDFCYWLQGYFEIVNPRSLASDQYLTNAQVEMVKRHLALVFKHEIDPSIDGGNPQAAAVLQAMHDGPKPGGVGPDGLTYRC